MLDTPAAEQLPGCVGGELWSAVSCQRRGYPECCKCVPQGVGQSRGAVGGWGDDGPARVAIDQHQVCCTFVMEEISTNVLKGIL